MSDTNKISRLKVRKLLVKQQMVEQRQVLKSQLQPLISTTERAMALFTNNNNKRQQGKTRVVTAIALLLAVLGKRKGSWLGKMARYVIISYPGLLYKFIK